MTSLFTSRRWAQVAFLAAGMVWTSSLASAETLLMPTRDYRAGVAEVVWGVTTQANGTGFTIDYGDGTNSLGADCGADTVADRSFIACSHTYANPGQYTVTLTVGGEQTTVVVKVFNPAANTEALRDLNVNRTIADALRYLWVAQTNRAGNFPAGVTTDWGGVANYPTAAAALVVLAFENHGYRLPNNNNAPTGVYEKYIVRRGLNFLLNQMKTLQLGAQPAGDPCAVYADCVGLYANQDGGVPPGFSHSAYETGLLALPFAGSGALSRTVTEVAGTNNGGYVVNKTLGEILQRIVNGLAWGQIESASGRGGWYYNHNASASSDGSTVGWVLLALLDSEAAGMTIPAFVRTEWGLPNNVGALSRAFNTSGSFDYQSDGFPTSNSSVNMAKTGVGLQGAVFAGRPVNDTDVVNALDFISDGWNEANPVNGAFQSFICQNSRYNKGCGYGMFNIFKGLKLYGINTLPGVGRPAGPGSIVANDWHADYEDFLVANQTNPTGIGGNAGSWSNAGAGTMAFSSQTQHDPSEAALSLLILAPVALVLPDEGLFSTVGLSPSTDTNRPGTSHTVTATTQAANGSPIPGTTVTFTVLSGPNTGKTGSSTTNQQGQATFTYQDTSLPPWPKTDTIRASVGNINSNIVSKVWVLRCDADSDNDVDNADLTLIRNAFGQAVSSQYDPRDGNADQAINVLDLRWCQTRFTPAPAPAP